MGVKNWWSSLTAAVGNRKGLYDGSPFSMTAGTRGWEAEATHMYDIVPELRYGISWSASSASRAALIAAKVPSHPAAQPVPIDESSREALPLRELAPTAPEQSVFLSRITTLLKLVGKWWLVGFDDPVIGGRRRWLVLSDREYTEVGSQIRFMHPDTGQEIRMDRLVEGLAAELRPRAAWVIPMWFPHPMDSSMPDAPVRALIDTLHELVDLSGHVQTAARSRLAGAGLLLMPSSLKPIAPGQSTGVNPPKGNPAMRALTRTAQAAFQNPQDVSRHLPVIFEGNQEALNAVRHLTLDTPFDERVDSLRTSAVRRIAIGLDIPPEVLSGMGDLNHWTAWQVDSAGQKINVAPSLAFICRELTRKYYQPALQAMGVPNPQQYMIWYDDTSLENTPNKAEVALSAYELGLVSGDAARETIGYGPADAPPEGWIPPVVKARLARTEAGRSGDGPASTEETQTRFPPAAANGWIACADVAARRALGRAGSYLLNSGGRQLRGKYRDIPLHDIHTHVSPGNADITAACLKGAFAELEAAQPALVAPVAAYTRQRLAMRKPHDLDVLTTYLKGESDACDR
jgi:hypothetical protein